MGKPHTSTAKISQDNLQTLISLRALSAHYSMGCWTLPKDQQNKTDNMLSETGTPYATENSRKNLSKASGPDCIPVVFLKNCEPERSYILVEFFLT